MSILVDRDQDYPRESLVARAGEHPEEYLRLVSNPFLGFLVVALGGWMGFRLSQSPTTMVSWLCFIPLVVALWWLPRLCQVHCLDCGRNELLGDWKDHRCHAVEQRYLAPTRSGRQFPSPILQFWAWVQVVACGLAVAWLVIFAR